MLSAEQIVSDLGALREIAIRHKAPDAPLAVGSAIINGIETPVFTKVPENLHGLYQLALDAPDLPFLIYQDERYSHGENIGCGEVEYALAEHPQVCEVAVFGLPDTRLGEILVTTVMIKPGATVNETELQAFLQTRLAQFKIPSRIWLQTEQLERIASGKIAKKQIRDAIIKEMQNQSDNPWRTCE